MRFGRNQKVTGKKNYYLLHSAMRELSASGQTGNFPSQHENIDY